MVSGTQQFTTPGVTITASERLIWLIPLLLPGPAARAGEAVTALPNTHAARRAPRLLRLASWRPPLRATALWPGAGHVVQPRKAPRWP